MNLIKNFTQSKFNWIIIYPLLFISCYCLLYFIGLIKSIPTKDNLITWDASWYYSIFKDSYILDAGKQNNLAFFPLFPVLWKIIGDHVFIITAINILLSISGGLIIQKLTNAGNRQMLLLFSAAPVLFCFLPYSEALFFFFSALFLFNLNNERTPLIYIFLFLACLSRSVTMLFLPVFIFTEILCATSWRVGLFNIIKLGGTAVLGLVSVLLIQHYYTGSFFGFFKAQSIWSHYFKWPHFPLATWDNVRILWLDGGALILGLFCIALGLALFKRRISSENSVVKDRATIFSIGYLGAIVLVVLFFNGYDEKNRTTIYSLSRYFFATPFFFVAALKCKSLIQITRKNAIIVGSGIALLSCIAMGLPNSLDGYGSVKPDVFQTYVYFMVLLISILPWVFIHKAADNRYLFAAILAINIAIQSVLYSQFLRGYWVG